MMRWWAAYDFFVAYSHHQEQWVGRLVADLRRRGFRVFIDKDIRPGDEWEKRLAKAISRTRVGLVVLSEAARKSDEVQKEIVVLLYEVRVGGKRLVPVFYEGAELPDNLKAFQAVAVDFRDGSEAAYEGSLRRLVLSLPRSWRWSLRGLAYASLLIVAISMGLAIVSDSARVRDQAAMRKLQEHMQDIDVRVQGHAPPSRDGEYEYDDPATGRRMATDKWEGGRLAYRWFYEQDRLIARDTFSYGDADVVIEKTREYISPARHAFLTDWFTPGGALRRKCAELRGEREPCTDLVDDLRSPLPPSWTMYYR